MAGYNVMFQPFANGKPSGPNEVFADGLKGKDPLMSPAEAAARPDGTAQGPDGSIYITESVNGNNVAGDLQRRLMEIGDLVSW